MHLQNQTIRNFFAIRTKSDAMRKIADSRLRLTGEKVEFATDVMSTTVTYWRPKVGSSVRRAEASEGTTPKTTPTSQKEKGPELRQKMIRIMKATPTISKAELADLLRITVD